MSSHNDLKPENILFDGDRVWLVDWEAAFLNDRYIDLAVVANFAINREADEQAYLQGYFGPRVQTCPVLFDALSGAHILRDGLPAAGAGCGGEQGQ